MELASEFAYILAGIGLAFAVYAASGLTEKWHLRIWMILNAIAILALWWITPWVSGVPLALAPYVMTILVLGQRLRRKVHHS
jgi:hypothetical protein